MAVRRNQQSSDQQLDLFSTRRPTHDTPDTIRPDGRETLARTPSENGAQLRAKGLLQQTLLDAEEKTKDEMATLRLELMKLGKTAQQAHTQAWEMVREKYILLPPETS